MSNRNNKCSTLAEGRDTRNIHVVQILLGNFRQQNFPPSKKAKFKKKKNTSTLFCIKQTQHNFSQIDKTKVLTSK